MNNQPNEKKIDVARDYWELMTIKLKRRVSVYYRLLVAFSLLFYIVCFGSGALISRPNDFKQTPLNESKSIESMDFKMVDRTYNQAQGIMEIDFVGEDNSPSIIEQKDIDFEVLGKGLVSKELKVTVLEGERNYYAVFIEKIPSQWEGLMITLGENGEETNLAKFVTVQSKLNKESSVSMLTKEEVVYKSIEYQINLRNTEAENQEKKISSNNKKIKQLKEEIKLLEDDKVYQTEAQLKDTDGRIQQIETTIDSYQSSSLEIKKQQVEIRKQVEKLKEKQGHVYRKDVK